MSPMRKSDSEALTPGQQWRLRIALDRVMPAYSPARYRSRTTIFRPWTLAPVTLALAITGVLGLSAYAATGSANPAVWGQRAESTIQSVRLVPQTQPGPVTTGAPTPAGSRPGTTGKSAAPPTSHAQDPEEHDRYGQHHWSPTPSGGSSGSHQQPSPSPSPSPTPSPSPSGSPSPSPSPGGSPNPWDH